MSIQNRVSLVHFLLALFCVGSISACKKSGSNGGGTSAAATTATTATQQGPVTNNPAQNVAPSNLPPAPRLVRAARNARNDDLWNLGQQASQNMNLVCTRGYQGGEKMAASVTHYYIPPNTKVGDQKCRNGLAYFGQPAMAGTCLHPCRALAADPRYHRPGEVIFFKNLVGLTCGTGRNKMVHDGFMVVTDNGNPDAINVEGRFGLFWGKCNVEQNGFCLDEGAVALDFALTFSPYCRAWRPLDPLFHDDIKLAVYNAIRSEAVRRGDNQVASKFDLDAFVGLSVDPSGRIVRRFNPPAPGNPFANGN